MKQRLVQPEILDSLPESHPDALANRRDLRLINVVMGNHRWFARHLRQRLTASDRILEIGAGTGDLGLFLSHHLNPDQGITGLDLWSRPAIWPAEWPWRREDIMHFEGYDEYTILLGNLILHQFDNRQLLLVGERIRNSRIRLILVNEPARRRIHKHQLLLLRPFGLHPVSRHDGRVSIEGGFLGSELPEALGLDPEEWHIRTCSGFFGWHRMVAERREQP